MTKKLFLTSILVPLAVCLFTTALLFPEISKPAKVIKPIPVPILQAQIQEVRELFDGSSLTEFDLKGKWFGFVQGTKKVYFGSTPHNQVLMWTSTALTITMPATLNYGQEHIVTIRQGSTIISNAFKFFVLRRLSGTEPTAGSPGQTITQWGYYLGASQGSKLLKIGGVTVNTIVSWSNTAIVFKVPAGLAPGNHEIYIMDGGKIVSNKNNFTVL